MNRPTPCAFLDDGYTLDFHIAEVPGVSMALNGHYRPMTSKEIDRFLRGLNPDNYGPPKGMANPPKPKKDVAECLDEFQSSTIASHIVDWDLTNQNGDPVPVSAANLSRLYPPSLLARLVNKVSGLGQQTPAGRVLLVVQDSTLSVDEKLEKIQAILTKPDGDTEEATDEKN